MAQKKKILHCFKRRHCEKTLSRTNSFVFTFSAVVVLPSDCILSFLFPTETDVLVPVLYRSTEVVVVNFVLVLKFPIPRFGYSHQYWQSYTQKKGKIWGKHSPLISLFTYCSLKIKFVPFVKIWAATIPCKRKTIKWATKLLFKKKGRGKRESKRERFK